VLVAEFSWTKTYGNNGDPFPLKPVPVRYTAPTEVLHATYGERLFPAWALNLIFNTRPTR
jgi:hypothetical protein